MQGKGRKEEERGGSKGSGGGGGSDHGAGTGGEETREGGGTDGWGGRDYEGWYGEGEEVRPPQEEEEEGGWKGREEEEDADHPAWHGGNAREFGDGGDDGDGDHEDWYKDEDYNPVDYNLNRLRNQEPVKIIIPDITVFFSFLFFSKKTLVQI